MVIAFDVDGTLIDKNDRPREEVISLLMALARAEENIVVVWSGGGEDYARMWVERLMIGSFVSMTTVKTNPHLQVDLAIDDMEVKLGKFNLKV